MNTLSIEEESIEYLKSGISINTKLGCKMGCKYCIVSEFQTKIQKTFTPEELVENLLISRFFDSKIPLLINNRSEPLSPTLKKDTLNILKILKERGIQNKKIIISKLPLGEIDYSSLKDNNVYLFRTISGMPTSVEPFSTQSNLQKILKENLLLRKETDVKIIHYWRPLVRGLNTFPAGLEKLLTEIIPCFDASVISGIRLTQRLKKIMENLGADLSDWNNDINHKFLPADLLENIIELKNKINESYQLFRHTSCAISSLEKKPDYNMHYTKEKNKSTCQNCYNKSVCYFSTLSVNIPVLKTCFQKLKKSFDFEIINDTVHILSPIYQDEISFIKQTTHYNIKADSVLKSGSERVINVNKVSSH